VGQAAQETVVPGVAATEDVNFNTSYATLPATLESFACGKIWDVTTSSFVTTTGLFKCTGPSTGVTLPFTSVPITITPTGVTVAQLQKSTSISMAAFLWVPLFALLTWFGSRKSPRRNFFRFLGLILLALGLSYSTGCGGSYSLTPSPTTGTGAALPGTYLVQVIAFDGPNQTGNKYYAVVSVVVNSN
jgi:hypothetical protein